MILPIIAYGHPVLKKRAKEITTDFTELNILIANMWETMYNAQGVGLAAPQIGTSIRLFLVDTVQMEDNTKKNRFAGIKQVFINPYIVEEKGKLWTYEEGCLSIPQIRGDVSRKETIVIEYLNEKFEPQKNKFDGVNARVIQHEYDHIEGILFTEKLKPLKKRMLKRKLEDIKKGNIRTDYRMKFTKR